MWAFSIFEARKSTRSLSVQTLSKPLFLVLKWFWKRKFQENLSNKLKFPRTPLFWRGQIWPFHKKSSLLSENIRTGCAISSWKEHHERVWDEAWIWGDVFPGSKLGGVCFSKRNLKTGPVFALFVLKVVPFRFFVFENLVLPSERRGFFKRKQK